VAVLEQRFAAALHERTAQMQRLAAVPGGPASDPDALRDYQASVRDVVAIRREARTLVGGQVDAAGRPKDDEDTNDIFCRFILDRMPPVVLGLIIAAIFAAAMSSIDSVLNALSGATIVDIYRRWLHPHCSEAHAVRAGKVMTLVWGVVATTMALFFAGGGSVIEQINKFGSFFYGSLLGIFALALFVPRAGAKAGAFGLCGGMSTVLVVHWTLRVEFLWYNVVGCIGVLATGGLVALWERRRPT
jgi:Na+/proline symporter